MKEKNKIFNLGIITMLILIIFSIILLYYPANTINVVYYGLGTILIIGGLIELIAFIIDLRKKKEKHYLLVLYGILFIFIALFIMIKKDSLASWLNIVVGIIIILSQCFFSNLSYRLKKQDNKNCKTTMLITTINVLLSIILIINKTPLINTQLISLTLFITSILNIIEFAIFKTNYIKEEIN